MNSRHLHWIFICLLVSLVSFTVGVRAAPAVKRANKSPDPVQSLVDLKQIKFKLGSIPEEIRELVPRSQLHERCVQTLTKLGFKVGEAKDVPIFRLSIYSAARPDKDIVSYCLLVELMQAVRVDRIDSPPLVVPTFVNVALDITEPDKLIEFVERDRAGLMFAFNDAIRRSSANK